MRTQVLLVDDDEAVHALVAAVIGTLDGFRVRAVSSAHEALEAARCERPDLIISDVSMPDMDGLALCQAIRDDATLKDVPLLLLTARADLQDKYQGFLRGADDYLVKPFDPIELQFRVRVLVRRGAARTEPASAARPLRAGPFTLDAQRSVATSGALEIHLTASELAILAYLAERPEQVVNIETLLTEALGYPARLGSPSVIHTHMRNLRAKIRDAGADPAFLGSSRLGYMLTR